MADGFDFHLNGERAVKLKAAATAAGLDATDLVLQIIDTALDDSWAEDIDRIAEYKRTGESISAEDLMQGLRDGLAARRAG